MDNIRKIVPYIDRLNIGFSILTKKWPSINALFSDRIVGTDFLSFSPRSRETFAHFEMYRYNQEWHNRRYFEHPILTKDQLLEPQILRTILSNNQIPESEKEKTISYILNKNKSILIRTHPAVLSEILVYMCNSPQNFSIATIEKNTIQLCQIVEEVGDISLIISLLKIGGYVSEEIHCEINHTVEHILHYVRGDGIVKILCRPDFLHALVDYAPEILGRLEENILQIPFRLFEDVIVNDPEKLVSYMSLAGKLSSTYQNRWIRNFSNMLDEILHESIIGRYFTDEKNLTQLSVQDLSIVYQYFRRVENKRICAKIKKILSHVYSQPAPIL